MQYYMTYKVLSSKPSSYCMRCLLFIYCLSLWLTGTVRAEPETVISRAWVQYPDPAE